MRRSGVRSSSSPPKISRRRAAYLFAAVRAASGTIALASRSHPRGAGFPRGDDKMLNKLMPREGRFFDLFNAHAAQIVEGAKALGQLMANTGAADDHARRIDEAERSAD